MIPELLLFLKKCCKLGLTAIKNLLIDGYNFLVLLFIHPKQKRKYKYKKRLIYKW